MLENNFVTNHYHKALKGGYALGAFNFASLETLEAILTASQEKNAPVIASVSEGAIKYLKQDILKGVIKAVKQRGNSNVMFHLDHGKSFEACKMAIELGFDSVMIDASSLPFSENVKLTKQVCDYAHERGVFVEGEIGVLAGVEDEVSAEETIYTDPEQAKQFVNQTGVDSLAIAIGTSHGAYKFKGKAELSTDILTKIQELIPSTPLVLHGASSVYEEYVNIFNKFGGTLAGAKGVPDEILKDVCTNYNICKINTDTDLRICFVGALRQSLAENTDQIDLRKHNAFAIEKTKQLIKAKIAVLGL